MSNPGFPLSGETLGLPTQLPQPPAPTTAEGQTQMGPQFPTQKPRKFQGTGVIGLAQTIIQQTQARKKRELDQSMTMFIGHSKSVQEAQGQMEEAQKLIQTGMQRLQANPKDPQGRDLLQQGAKLRQNAQQAMQSAQTNLRDMFNGPKGQKHYKMLEKAMGIDEKSQASPERQALIQAIQKQQQVDAQTAKLLSYLPQRQQLGPQAASQAMLTQAGAQGKPMSQYQDAQLQNQQQRLRIEQYKAMSRAGVSDAYVQLRATKQGEVAERGSDGEWKLRPMNDQEKAIWQNATQGKLAWTKKDGKIVAVLRNPQTNQIIPGSENPAILPPAYLMDQIREGNYFWTDNDGNVHETPTETITKHAEPGTPVSHKVTPITPNVKPRAQTTAQAGDKVGIPGDKILGKGRPTYASNQMAMEFEKDYVVPSENVEKSFQQMMNVWNEYQALAKAGRHLDTGAQSMLMLSQHLQTTFGQTKGSRVTKDMISHHLGARSISDDALVAFQKLVDGDPLSPGQWVAFHDLVTSARREQWSIAIKEARRHKVPVNFVPKDLLQQGVGAPEGFKRGRDGAVVGSDGRTLIGWQIDGKFVEDK
jgi:hypothetical protein